MLLLPLLVACAGPPDLEARAVPGGIEVHADAPVHRVEIVDGAGVPVLSRDLPAATETVRLDAPLDPGGSYDVRAWSRGGQGTAHLVVPVPRLPAHLAVEAPLGQPPRPVEPGSTLTVLQVGEEPVDVGLVLTATEAATLVVDLGSGPREVSLGVPGERKVVEAALTGPTSVSVRSGERSVTFALAPAALTEDQARARLELVSTTFPADRGGTPDPALPRGRVTLPSQVWTALVRGVGLGTRAADAQAPWAWEAVTLRNRGEEPMDVALRAGVVDLEGRPAPAFRPRMREADGQVDRVTVLLRVPPGREATATLPLWVDRARAHPGQWTRELEVLPLGASTPLWTDREPLYVSRGSPWATAALLGTLLGAAAGLLLLALGSPRWLRRFPTSDLTTIALFGSLVFVVSAASRLVGTAIGALLGPFAPLVYGLADDILRTALLATLVTLLPRPGVASLAVIVGWLLNGLAMGSLNPVDLAFVGARVAWLEGALWLTGVTRSPRWRDRGPGARWLHLSAAMVLASLLSTASGLVLHVALYRLYFAAWYVAMVLALPGSAYVLVGCALAVPFGDSLRKVEA